MAKTLPVIYCAIDNPDLAAAKALAAQIVPAGCGVKLGMEFFNANGPQGVRAVMDSVPSASIFLDLKYHDIPNTVAGAVRAASALGIDYLNVHAAGGLEMLRAAKDACAPGTRLIAVTVLTSLDDENLRSVGQSTPAADQVKRLALLTQQAGLDGVVCSAHEIALLRQECGPDFALMVPGIRPAGADIGDQKRIMTPPDALAAGATHLVIGRPITQAADPARAAKDILESLHAAR
jgi:orotidine-5'-phosphate decarboxylase